MHDNEMSCGQELAASAEVPDAICALMNHVALNLDAHASWVGSGSESARLEQVAMERIAGEYRAVGSAASNAAAAMRACVDLEPAPHDPRAFDRSAFADWMQKKIELQRALANLLLGHAEMSEKALAAMGRRDE